MTIEVIHAETHYADPLVGLHEQLGSVGIHDIPVVEVPRGVGARFLAIQPARGERIVVSAKSTDKGWTLGVLGERTVFTNTFAEHLASRIPVVKDSQMRLPI